MNALRVVLVLVCAAVWSMSCAGPDTKPDPDALKTDGGDPLVKEAPVEVAVQTIDWETKLIASTWTTVKLDKRPKGIYHVTDIAARGTKDRVVATFGRGIYVSRDGGKKWRQFEKPRKASKKRPKDPKAPTARLKTDYLSGVDFLGQSIWVRSVGHGFGHQSLNKRNWQWWSSRQLDREFLFPTAFKNVGESITIATTDGLWRTANRGRAFEKITPDQGLPSEYVLAYEAFPNAPEGVKGEWVGLLGGLHHIAPGGQTRTLTTKDGLPSNTIRGIHEVGGRIIVRTDLGLGVSADGGKSWRSVGLAQGMPAGHTYDLVARDDTSAYAGTAKGIAVVDLDKAEVIAVHLSGPLPRRNQINALNLDGEGRLWAGTSDGLWHVEPGDAPVSAKMADPCQPSNDTRTTKHPIWPRPISTAHNPYIDQTYQFGQTWGGQFGVHKGVEFNNAEGTQVLAVANGEVVYAQNTKRGTGSVIVLHDEQYGGQYVYSLYVHLSGFLSKVGDKVKPGTPVGLVGHTGPATNDHLHLEVRLSKTRGDGMMDDAIKVNPALFLARLPGRGTLAGTVRKGDKRVNGARVYGTIIPEPQDTPFGFYEVYGRGAYGDPVLGEDFMIMDVAPGVYPIEVVHRRETRTACVKIEAGKIAWIDVEF